MIGGTDITMRTTAGATAIDLSVRVIRATWPSAVYEDAITGTLYNKYSDLSFRSLSEVFVYRDLEAYQKWDQLGADPTNENTMIHLLVSSSTLTVVVDGPDDPAIISIIASIDSSLRMDILNITAQMRVAA